MTHSAGLAFLPDLHLAEAAGLPIFRRQIAPPSGPTQRVPLIPGTERFAGSWLPTFHRDHLGWITHDVAVYSVLDARIAGDGWIWLEDRLVTAPEVMPAYVAAQLDVEHGGHSRLHRAVALPVRSIETPCLVAAGQGVRVYGHFLTEMLFRILLARAAFRDTGLRYNLLLDRAAPAWLLHILIDDLKISQDDLAFFDPEVEQVRLRHAIVPSFLLQAGGFHLMANDMLATMLAGLTLPSVAPTAKRFFISRRGFSNPASA